MLEVAKLESLGVYRDGGSLGVSFIDNKGNLHELVFLIDNYASEQRKTSKVYRAATIESYISKEVISPITGISRKESEKLEKSITWEDAKEFLHQLEPQINGFVSEYKWVFESMCKIANSGSHEIEYS